MEPRARALCNEITSRGRSCHIERVVNNRLNGWALKLGDGRYLTGIEEAERFIEDLQSKEGSSK